jgi:hypothetical protein
MPSTVLASPSVRRGEGTRTVLDHDNTLLSKVPVRPADSIAGDVVLHHQI